MSLIDDPKSYELIDYIRALLLAVNTIRKDTSSLARPKEKILLS